MWGFNLEAYSNTTFTRSRGASSEGELWMKYLFSKTTPDELGDVFTGLLDGIESQFGGMAKALRSAIYGVSSEFLLFVWNGDTGHAIFHFHFTPDTPKRMIEREFLVSVKRSGTELGDQVMIHLGDTIKKFEDFLVLNQLQVQKVKLPILHINIFF
ncbi:MAG TPA: hypothetical protein VJ890_22485 [Vineibacter sp.]|nr:hypothetical protein [Vineibacter sp.]